MTTKHTPGPWKTGTKNRGRFSVYSVGNHGRGICSMLNTQTQSAWEVEKYGEHELNKIADANARLIAAAPDLLAALESLFEHCAMVHKHWGENSNNKEADAAIASALAAIARATGTR